MYDVQLFIYITYIDISIFNGGLAKSLNNNCYTHARISRGV